MRGTNSRTSALVDVLESRMLLAANWAGTWQVSGMDLTMRSLPTNGQLAVTSPAMTVALTHGSGNTYTAVLTTQVGKQVRTETQTLHTDAQGLAGDFTSQDTAANGQIIHWQTYIRMMEVDANVRMFDMTSVGYTDNNGTQRVYEINVFAGVASQQKLQVVSFPYTGNYTFHGFNLTVDTESNHVTVLPEALNPSGQIEAAGSRRYTISANGTTPELFTDRSGRLSRIVAGPTRDNATYVRNLQMYYRGPDGRLYYRGGGMTANTNPQLADAQGAVPVGQILSGWTTAGYSDTAPYNFAPILTPGTVALTTINEDQTDNQGTAISQIIDSSDITDWNGSGHKGLAITSFNSRSGAWQYSTNGGTSWQAVGKVSTGHALLLADSDQNRIRFIPKTNYNGTVTKAISFRAWDQSSGANGTYASASRAGKLAAFSTTRNYATLQVTAVDDAPVLSGILADLNYAGTPLRVAGGLKIADVDNKLLSGATVQITGGLASGDTLAYPGTVPGISTVPVLTDGLVALTGNAPLSAYLAAIRSITFTSSSATSGPRTISITVNDGTLASNTVTQIVHVPAAISPLATSLFSETPLAGEAASLLA